MYLGVFITSSFEYRRITRILQISMRFDDKKQSNYEKNSKHFSQKKTGDAFEMARKVTSAVVGNSLVGEIKSGDDSKTALSQNKESRLKTILSPEQRAANIRSKLPLLSKKRNKNSKLKTFKSDNENARKDDMINELKRKTANKDTKPYKLQKVAGRDRQVQSKVGGEDAKTRETKNAVGPNLTGLQYGMDITELDDEIIHSMLKKNNFDINYVEQLFKSQQHTDLNSGENKEPSNLKFYPLNIIWVLNIDRSSASRGFIYESFDFLLPLSRIIDNIGWWSNMKQEDVKKNHFLKDLNQEDQNRLVLLSEKGNRLKEKVEVEGTIVIVTELPQMYDTIFEHHGLKHAVYKIGRLMFETTFIPYGWAEKVNQHLDEVWVPSNFAKDVFLVAGIEKKISVIHEGFDTELFGKQITPSLKKIWRNVLFPNCEKDDLIILTGN